MSGFKHGSKQGNDLLNVSSAAFGMAVSEDAAALRALAVAAPEMSLGAWLDETLRLRGAIAQSVLRLARDAEEEMPPSAAVEWATQIAAAALEWSEDEVALLRTAVIERMGEAA